MRSAEIARSRSGSTFDTSHVIQNVQVTQDKVGDDNYRISGDSFLIELSSLQQAHASCLLMHETLLVFMCPERVCVLHAYICVKLPSKVC